MRGGEGVGIGAGGGDGRVYHLRDARAVLSPGQAGI